MRKSLYEIKVPVIYIEVGDTICPDYVVLYCCSEECAKQSEPTDDYLTWMHRWVTLRPSSIRQADVATIFCTNCRRAIYSRNPRSAGFYMRL